MQELFELYERRGWDKPFVVQIGAMDGIEFDNSRHLLDRYDYPGLFVEPIPKMFDRLISNFGDREHYTFEQAAITEKDGNVRMLTVDADLIEKENLHPGYKGMSALYPLRNGFGSDYERDIEVKGKFGQNIVVPGMTFETLAKKHSLPTENLIVLCDVEGHDCMVFKQVMKITQPIWMKYEWMYLKPEEQAEMKETALRSGYITMEEGQDILFVRKDVYEELERPSEKLKAQESPENHEGHKSPESNFTIVSGLWNLNREGRSFEEYYIPRFKEFLKIDSPMILFLPESLHELVWSIRKPSNTFIKKFELEDIRQLYSPHWELTQKIRTDEKWLNMTGEGGWLRNSPQANLEYYNPIVQSKMFMLHDASCYNSFDTEYYYWIDAGLTSTVPSGHLIHDRVLDKLPEICDSFLFLSYPYEARDEIHGFDIEVMNTLANSKVEYVCRGGLFGGHKDVIKETNGEYYGLLQKSLSMGVMGTEESLFSIMSYNSPATYRRFMLDGNGLIVKFTEAVTKNNVVLEEIPDTVKVPNVVSAKKLKETKTNLYMLTFNFPKQVQHTIDSMKKTPEWLSSPELYLLDNSTNDTAREQNRKIAEENNFNYISLGENKGICGGRQAAAEHFHNSDADYMFFFEDDMTVNSSEEKGKFCRKGFRKHIPDLYKTLHKIAIKEDFDFLKLSFSEVYWDNNIQTSWYNVPQIVRDEVWPDYNRLPVQGIDPNAPRTKFDKIDEVDGVSYITGEVFYCNWPMLVSKKGNQKMFIDTKWAHPYEQTWMSHIYQETLKGNIKPAVLLASPIWHDRIAHYTPQERREN